MVRTHLALVLVPLALAVALPAAADLHYIEMKTQADGFQPRFFPNDLTIEPGDTVRWINADPFGFDHAVASGAGSADPAAGQLWESGTLGRDEYFEFTFRTVGEFEFFSRPHEFAGMFGIVRVGTDLDTGQGFQTGTWAFIKDTLGRALPK